MSTYGQTALGKEAKASTKLGKQKGLHGLAYYTLDRLQKRARLIRFFCLLEPG